MLSRPTREDFLALADAAASGALRPVVTRSYPLADAGRALDDLARGAFTGKAVVIP
jgi:NADPH:quinone reductase-like Zn-dependent oxidoreductase